MKRRYFIKQVTFLAGAALPLLYCRKADGQADDTSIPKKIKGKITAAGSPLAGVVISDGYHVVASGNDGKYELPIHPDAVTVFVSPPAGRAFVPENNISRHYRQLQNINRKKNIDFDFAPLSVNDNEHQFIIWADPQVKNAADVSKLMQTAVPDVAQLAKDAGSGALLHGITVGDIVWDEHKLFADYDKAVGKMGMPFFQCLGNHDMDYNKGGDETSDDTFQQLYGPTYYSFNRGQVHYVVMDNVRYLGKDREYDGFFQQNQLDWLKKDLSFVPADKLIVLCVHIPVHNGTKNNAALYSLLEGRKVHIMSGHTHYHRNVIKGDIYEHNHGTVCGAWWTGPICGDGTPNGYGVYTVKGKELQWHYKATGLPAGYQMKLYIKEQGAGQKQLLANIWNHDPEWKTEYIVDGSSKGALTQADGFDPVAYETLLGPEKPKPRGFAEPRKTGHLFHAMLPSGAKEVTVVATDRFGKKYTATQTI